MTVLSPLLLDTCVIVFSSLGTEMRAEATDAISLAVSTGRVHISSISAWEIGMGIAKGRIKSTLPPLGFFQRYVSATNASICDLSPEILVNSSFLPGEVHGDPMDRILIATAREHDLTVVTRDRAILAYSRAGHVKALAC